MLKNVLVVWPKDSVLYAERKVILLQIAESEVRSKYIQLCFLLTYLKNQLYIEGLLVRKFAQRTGSHEANIRWRTGFIVLVEQA